MLRYYKVIGRNAPKATLIPISEAPIQLRAFGLFVQEQKLQTAIKSLNTQISYKKSTPVVYNNQIQNLQASCQQYNILQKPRIYSTITSPADEIEEKSINQNCIQQKLVSTTVTANATKTTVSKTLSSKDISYNNKEIATNTCNYNKNQQEYKYNKQGQNQYYTTLNKSIQNQNVPQIKHNINIPSTENIVNINSSCINRENYISKYIDDTVSSLKEYKQTDIINTDILRQSYQKQKQQRLLQQNIPIYYYNNQNQNTVYSLISSECTNDNPNKMPIINQYSDKKPSFNIPPLPHSRSTKSKSDDTIIVRQSNTIKKIINNTNEILNHGEINRVIDKNNLDDILVVMYKSSTVNDNENNDKNTTTSTHTQVNDMTYFVQSPSNQQQKSPSSQWYINSPQWNLSTKNLFNTTFVCDGSINSIISPFTIDNDITSSYRICIDNDTNISSSTVNKIQPKIQFSSETVQAPLIPLVDINESTLQSCNKVSVENRKYNYNTINNNKNKLVKDITDAIPMYTNTNFTVVDTGSCTTAAVPPPTTTTTISSSSSASSPSSYMKIWDTVIESDIISDTDLFYNETIDVPLNTVKSKQEPLQDTLIKTSINTKDKNIIDINNKLLLQSTITYLDISNDTVKSTDYTIPSIYKKEYESSHCGSATLECFSGVAELLNDASRNSVVNNQIIR